MSKGILVIVVFIVLGLMAFANLPRSDEPVRDIAAEKAEAMAEVETFDLKLMYDDAKARYVQMVNDYPDDREIKNGYVDYCFSHGFDQDAVTVLNDMLTQDPSDKESAEKLLKYYRNTNDTAIYSLMNAHKDILEDNEIYGEVMDELYGKVDHFTRKYSEVTGWQMNKGYMFVKNGLGKSGVLDAAGQLVFPFNYDTVESYSEEGKYAAVYDHDQLVYVSIEGKRRLVPFNNSTKELVYLDHAGPIEQGVANVGKDGKWAIAGTDMLFEAFTYDMVTPFSCNVMAVCSEGNWMIANSDLSVIYSGFEGIYTDDYGYCCFNDVLFLKYSGKYKMFILERDESKKAVSVRAVSDLEFDDVRPFGQYGAVCIDGKWGFVRSDGTWLIEPQYANAYSFVCGFAPIEGARGWKYIDESGETVINENYEGATAFNVNGFAAVKSEGVWDLIRLTKKQYFG